MQVVNLEAMALALGASVVIAFLIERLKTLAEKQWDALPDKLKAWGWLPGFVVGGALMAATRVNAFPIFDARVPGVGEALTCVMGALGPSAIYDLWDRLIKTKPPES
jgi:hypothetical protein